MCLFVMPKTFLFIYFFTFVGGFSGYYPVLDDFSSRRSPRPLCASLMNSSTSSFRRALSSPRGTFSVSPVIPPTEHIHSINGQRSNAPGSPLNQQLEKTLNVDPGGLSGVDDLQEDDPLDMQEVSTILYFIYWMLFIISHQEGPCMNRQLK